MKDKHDKQTLYLPQLISEKLRRTYSEYLEKFDQRLAKPLSYSSWITSSIIALHEDMKMESVG